MTILFLTRRFYPDVGGVEKHVLEISKSLIKNRHQVTVITESKGKENSIFGIEIKRIKTSDNWLKKFYIWKWLWDNRSLIKNADVVHAHDVYYWYFPFRFIFSFKRSFVTFHGYESYPISKRAVFVRKISEKLSNGNIIVGEFIKKWYGTKPDFVIYGATNIPKTFTNAKSRESAIFLGRLDEQTGILEYAEAADLITEKKSNFEFLILGDGKYKRQLSRYKTSGFKKNSVDYLKKYNFAFVSRYLSILEALAEKRLVFALYDNPVKEDYLRMSPFAKFIVIENSPENLAGKVEYYLKNSKKETEIVQKGFDWVKNQTWDNLVKIYLNLWSSK